MGGWQRCETTRKAGSVKNSQNLIPLSAWPHATIALLGPEKTWRMREVRDRLSGRSGESVAKKVGTDPPWPGVALAKTAGLSGESGVNEKADAGRSDPTSSPHSPLFRTDGPEVHPYLSPHAHPSRWAAVSPCLLHFLTGMESALHSAIPNSRNHFHTNFKSAPLGSLTIACSHLLPPFPSSAF